MEPTTTEKKRKTGLELLVNAPELLERFDTVLIDGSALNYSVFLNETNDYKIFEEYNTKQLLHNNQKTNEFLQIIQQPNVVTIPEVTSELWELNGIMCHRLKETTTTPAQNTHIRTKKQRYRKNNEDKSKVNKAIYAGIQNKLYTAIHKLSEKELAPNTTDTVLFNLIRKIGEIRHLKGSPQKEGETFADEWLVAQAYNKLIFENEKVAIITNDKDVGRLWQATSELFKTKFFEKQCPQIYGNMFEKSIEYIEPIEEVHFEHPGRYTYKILGMRKASFNQREHLQRTLKKNKETYAKQVQNHFSNQ